MPDRLPYRISERLEQAYVSCERKRRYTSRAGAEKAARRAARLFQTVLRVVHCRQFCGFLHLAPVRGVDFSPDAEERALGPPSREREERARVVTRAVVMVLDAREGRKRAGAMKVNMIPVKSSDVQAIGIDGERIVVQFANGTYECIYKGYGVSTPMGRQAHVAQVFERFKAVESKGRFYHEEIRRQSDVWTVRRLVEATEKATTATGGAAEESPSEKSLIEKGTQREKWVGEGQDLEELIMAKKSLSRSLDIVAMRQRPHNFELHENPALAVCGRCELPKEAKVHGGEQTAHVFQPQEAPRIGLCNQCGQLWDSAVHLKRPGEGEVVGSMPGNEDSIKRDSREEGGGHKFVYDRKGIGLSQDFCAECGYPRNHPVHSEMARVSEAATYERLRPRQVMERICRAKPALILTVGLPRSGKSTWARAKGVPVVCPDSVRLALHGQEYEPLAEPFVWAAVKLFVRSLFGAGHRTVILDACNVTRKRRDEWRNAEWETFFVPFGATAEECIRRAEVQFRAEDRDGSEGARRLYEVILRMGKEQEQLGDDEAVWQGLQVETLDLRMPPVPGVEVEFYGRGLVDMLEEEQKTEEKSGLPLDVLSALADEAKGKDEKGE